MMLIRREWLIGASASALRLLLLCLFYAAQSAPCLAWTHGSSAPSQLFLSLGASDIPGAFLNWTNACGPLNFNTGSSPASIDANGYPNISAPGATIFSACALPTLAQYPGTWEIGWSGTGEYTIQGTAITVTSDPQSCSKGSGKLAGTNCDVIFNFSTDPSISLQFNSGNTFSGMSGAFLVRSSDKTAYLAGQKWTPEFIAINRALNQPLVRTMGMTFPQQLGMVENSSGWNYRTPATAMSYAAPVWFPNLHSSSITGTDQYTATGATDTLGSWTDREMLQGNFPNASAAALNVTGAANNGSGLVRLTVSSSAALSTNQQVLLLNVNGLNAPPSVWTVTVIDITHIDLQGSTFSASWSPNASSCGGGGACLITTTINIASRGPKFIVGSGVLGSSGISAGDNGTLVYDATFAVLGTSPTTAVGAMFYTSGGVNAGVPIEAQVQLANTLGIPLWTNIPPYYQASSASSLATFICGAASSAAYLEYNNENWNFQFQAQWHFQHGLVLGLSPGSNNSFYSAIGLIYRQDMAAVTAACPSIRRVNAGQAFGSPSQFDSFQFKGQSLCGTSCGNSVYQALVGTDYNSAPNRPLDFTDDVSMASYFGGTQANGNNGTLTQLNGVCNGTTCTGIIAASACFAAPSNATCGTGGTAQLALNFIDNDARNGTYTDGSGNVFSIAALQSNIFPPWNTVAVNDGKPLIAYEGGFSSFGQTAGYLTSIGDANASADATNISNMLIAYRSSSLFNATYQFWNQQWFSNSKVVGNANLELEGQVIGIPINGQYWGMMSGTYLANGFYQNYPAACAVNHRSC